MRVIISVDDKGGMMFNKRRQSQDEQLRNYILELTSNEKLFMNEYSFKQFEKHDASNIIVAEDFLQEAIEKDFCFVENVSLSEYLNKITTVFLCKWNRNYPSDFSLDIDVEKHFKLAISSDITGKSHEKITIEEWSKL